MRRKWAGTVVCVRGYEIILDGYSKEPTKASSQNFQTSFSIHFPKLNHEESLIFMINTSPLDEILFENMLQRVSLLK